MNLTLNLEYTPLQHSLIAAVRDSYLNHLVSNAVFLAERLVAECSN